jgi:hypothetical protein
VADAVIFKNEAVRSGTKLYRRDTNGQVLLQNGKKVEIRGLKLLVDHSGWKGHRVLEDLADYIAEKLAPDRNAILHGAKTDYGSAKQSVRCLLVLWGLAELPSELETGKPIT